MASAMPRSSCGLSGRGTSSAWAAPVTPKATSKRRDRDEDLEHLREKAESGVDFLITQLFFDPAEYFAFVDRARVSGIRQPIVPGIMPITNVAQIERFTTMCGAGIPAELKSRLDVVRDDDEGVIETGV